MVDSLSFGSQDIFSQKYDKEMKARLEQSQKAKQQEFEEQSLMTQAKELEAKGCTDGKDDGKIGFWEGLKSVGKGALKFVTGMFTDKEGNFSIGQTLKTVAIGAGIAAVCVLTAGTAVPAIIAGAGVAASAGGLVKSGYQAATAETDADKRAALEGVGTSGVALGLSVVGAKGAMKSYNATNGITKNYSGIKGTAQAAWDSTMLGFKKGTSAVKTGWNAYKSGGFSNVKTVAVDGAKSFGSTVKGNYNAVTQRFAAGTAQEKRVAKYDAEIDAQKTAQAKTKVGTKEYKKIQAKIDELNTKKVNIEKAYADIDNASFEEGSKKIYDLDNELDALRVKLKSVKDSKVKADLKSQIEVLETKSKIYNDVFAEKVTKARNSNGKGSEAEVKAAQDLKTKGTEHVAVKQKAYDTAKADFDSATKALKGASDKTAAQAKVNAAKTAMDKASVDLSKSKNFLKQVEVNYNSTQGYDFVGSAKYMMRNAGDILAGQFTGPTAQYGTLPTGASNLPATLSTLPVKYGVTAQYGSLPVALGTLRAAQMDFTGEYDSGFYNPQGYSQAELAQIQAQMQAGTSQASATTGRAPTMQELMALESMLKMYGVS